MDTLLLWIPGGEVLNLQEENEKKKEYLSQYLRAMRREQDVLMEIQRLRADRMFPSIVNDGMPGGGDCGDLSDYVAILDKQIELLKKERLEKIRVYSDILKCLRTWEGDAERDVLWHRYIWGMQWGDIADVMGYSIRQILRIHEGALKNFKMS